MDIIQQSEPKLLTFDHVDFAAHSRYTGDTTPFREKDFYAEMRSVLPFLDTDSSRYTEYLFMLRSQYGIDTDQNLFEIPDTLATEHATHATFAVQMLLPAIEHYNNNLPEGVKPIEIRQNRARNFWRVFVVQNNLPRLMVLVGPGPSPYCVSLTGEPQLVNAIMTAYQENFRVPESLSLIKLLSFGANGPVTVPRTIPKNADVHAIDACYPYIEGGVMQLIEQFEASDRGPIIFFGPPGTGKSTMIREMMFTMDKKKNYHVSDERTLLHPDFNVWMESIPDNSFIGIEDAGAFVAPRGDSGNENSSMAAMLNFLQGVTKTKSKIALSTNLSNTSKIDPALTRRCFAVMNFRKLTLAEACAAREAAGLEAITDEQVKIVKSAGLVTSSNGGLEFSLADAMGLETLIHNGGSKPTHIGFHG